MQLANHVMEYQSNVSKAIVLIWFCALFIEHKSTLRLIVHMLKTA